MRKAERNVGVVAIHDHRREYAVQRVPDCKIGGERGERREDPGAVLRDVQAVQPQALLADSDRGVRIHVFEGALRQVRVLAQSAVELVVDGENQLGGRVYASVGGGALKAGVRILYLGFGLDRQGQPLLRSAVAMALIDS